MNEHDMKELSGGTQVKTTYSRTEFIWVTFDFEAFHAHKDASDGRYFLRSVHRHLFKARVELEVDPREPIDVLELKSMLDYHCQNSDLNNKDGSELCHEFFRAVTQHYKLEKTRDLGTGTRRIIIEVSDGESGTVRTYHPSNMVVDNGFFS